MILKQTGYTYSDLSIVPNDFFTTVKSRSECNARYLDGKLPIFASPMDSVVDEKNYIKFIEAGITPVIPRTVDFSTRYELMTATDSIFVAFSLNEFRKVFCDQKDQLKKYYYYRVCIDTANGHMLDIYNAVREAKENAGEYHIEVMVGNIANDHLYENICIFNGNFYSESYGKVIDYVRCSIGTGRGCITTSNTGIGYPPATLIDECRKVKQEYDKVAPKIIADGGIRSYRDAIIALALGADYVMIGSVFAQCIESAGVKLFETCMYTGTIGGFTDYSVDDDGLWTFEYNGSYYHDTHIEVLFYGMASKMGMKAMQVGDNKTPEGISVKLPVLYTLAGWCNKFESYLKSSMSYTDSRTLEEFIGEVTLIPMSVDAQNAINKPTK